MKTTNSSQIAQSLELLAGHIEALKLPPDKAAAMIREFAKKLNQKHAGRPPGSRTKADTPGLKRAREFYSLTITSGIRPTAAARIVVAGKSGVGVSESAVFKDARRHELRLVEEVKRETDVVRWELAQAVRNMYPDVFEKFLGEIRGANDLAASKLGGLTSPLVESWWREKLLGLEREVFMMLSEHICELHRSRRNTTDS